jgi:hypothetical protein
MLILGQSEAYAAFLNPRFRPLTAAAAVGFCLVGSAFLLRPHGRSDLLRTLCFAVLAVMASHAGSGALKSASGLTVRPPAEIRTDPDPYLVRNGDSYLKSNPARLFLSLQSGQAAAPGQRVVTRGIVKRSAQLDRIGKFALLRGNMVCCLADAIAMGMMVSTEGFEALRDGDWLVVFGRVRLLAEASPITDLRGTGEVPFSMVYDKAVLVAEAIEKIGRPRFPYVFELPASANRPLRLTGGEDDY